MNETENWLLYYHIMATDGHSNIIENVKIGADCYGKFLCMCERYNLRLFKLHNFSSIKWKVKKYQNVIHNKTANSIYWGVG